MDVIFPNSIENHHNSPKMISLTVFFQKILFCDKNTDFSGKNDFPHHHEKILPQLTRKISDRIRKNTKCPNLGNLPEMAPNTTRRKYT